MKEPVQPTSDWEDVLDANVYWETPEQESIVKSLFAQAKEEGRREEREWSEECYRNAHTVSRLATITLFEEERKRLKKLAYEKWTDETDQKAYCDALDDLLAFAEKMKSNTPNHD